MGTMKIDEVLTEKIPKTFYNVLIAFVAVGVLLILTFLAWLSAENYISRLKNDKFDLVVQETTQAVKNRLDIYTDVLYGAKGLFALDDELKRNEWTAYIKTQSLNERFPGIQALEFVTRVEHEDKNSFIEKTRLDTSLRPSGYPAFTIYPVGDRGEYFVVNYIEPWEGNEKAFGFDLASEGTRREALERARDTGLPAVTKKIILVQEVGEQAAFLIFLPIYQGNLSLSTVAQRQDALEGFVLAVFRTGDLFSNILDSDSINRDVNFSIFDGPQVSGLTAENELYRSDHREQDRDSSYGAEFVRDEEIIVAGQTWTIHFVSQAEFGLSPLENLLPLLALTGGLVLSFLLLGLFYLLVNSRQRAVNLAEEMTADLQKFKLAVEAASDHIMITDSEAKILYVNKAAEKITGYSKAEMVGARPSLWGGKMSKDFYQKMWQVIKADKKTFIGELNNTRKNGKAYVVELRISPVLDANNEVRFFVGLERDITKLKEIDRMKTEFISLVSHQLRTPLTAIRWFAEKLKRGEAGALDAEKEAMVNKIWASNKRMIDLVNGLLNVSRIESGRLLVEPEPTNLARLVKEVVEVLEPRIKENKHDLNLEIADGLPQVNIDPKLIGHVYTNLLINAIKYTPKGGKIVVNITQQEGQIISKITDNGLGIPEAQQERVFQKFFRGDNVIKKVTEGTGLGLYLVKLIIDASGGKIWYESKENKGTTFWFSIPLTGSRAKKGEVSITTEA